ncbi:MAG: DUF2325 domain-containing protein [Nitrosomonas sp.]|nr:DUF2325 domain-containing protein [Nitrosomonas sp.]
MKWVKKIVSDMISPVVNASAMLPYAVLARPDAVMVNTLNVFRRQIVDSFDTKNPAVRSEVSEKASCIPLIKASTFIADDYHNTLKRKSVLCVGGQIRLYPAYRQIVEDAGGQFMSFHGADNATDAAGSDLSDLYTLLNQADMIICPIDCIRHDAFFVVKEYCEHSSKPCVMLDKSRITAFYNGIRMLQKWNSS